MKKAAILILALSFGVIGWAGSSFALTIIDEYIGADPTGSGYDGEDIIGKPSWFSITHMDVNIVGDELVVDIHSAYFDNIGMLGTQLGDLFISTDPYNSTMPTDNDQFGSPGSEDWELAITLDGKLDGAGNPLLSGGASLYAVDEDDIVLSFAPAGYIYREGQEVQYDGSDEDLLASGGTWAVSADMDFLRISIDYMGLGWDLSDLNSLAFHYTMTCANDVIEGGGSPVPEPGTVFLLGAGLIAMAGLGRRKILGG